MHKGDVFRKEESKAEGAVAECWIGAPMLRMEGYEIMVGQFATITCWEFLTVRRRSDKLTCQKDFSKRWSSMKIIGLTPL
jgi:hypothetical protein